MGAIVGSQPIRLDPHDSTRDVYADATVSEHALKDPLSPSVVGGQHGVGRTKEMKVMLNFWLGVAKCVLDRQRKFHTCRTGTDNADLQRLGAASNPRVQSFPSLDQRADRLDR